MFDLMSLPGTWSHGRCTSGRGRRGALPFLAAPGSLAHGGSVDTVFPCAGCLRITREGTSLVAQWLRLHAANAGGPDSIPGQGTRSHMHSTTKSSHATTKELASCN